MIMKPFAILMNYFKEGLIHRNRGFNRVSNFKLSFLRNEQVSDFRVKPTKFIFCRFFNKRNDMEKKKNDYFPLNKI